MTKPTVEERLDIQELFARYCWSLNTGDADGYVACFAKNGWLQHFPPKRHQGADEIRTMLDVVWYSRPQKFLGRQHHPHNFIFERSPDGIAVRAYWSVTRLDQTTNVFSTFLQGDWDANCVVEDGEWKFASLKICHWLRHEAPWVGDPSARLVLPGDAEKAPGEF